MARTDPPSHPVVAALYDPLTAYAEKRILPAHRRYLARDLEGRVLDLGAGTGAMVPYFAEAALDAPSLAVHGIEPDPHMRRRASRTADEHGLEIELIAGVAEALPYADETFDTVVASQVFCTIPDIGAALAEVARVLTPAGELRFLEHVRADGAIGRMQDIVAPVWYRAAAGCHLNRQTAATFCESPRFDVAELRRLAIGVPPVTPYVRGTLTPRSGGASGTA